MLKRHFALIHAVVVPVFLLLIMTTAHATDKRVIELAEGTSSATGDQVQSLQEKMLGNAEIMSIIQALQNDPDMQEILNDPEIMKAVKEGNVSVLMTNPKFMKLLNNPAIQQIEKKIPQ